jgi:GT2 family glycosyltransferase
MAEPVVTVLIDTYNHERFIEQAIRSVLEQDFPLSDAEIIVVDDGSTDRTPELVRRFEPRVRLLQKKNGGQASAFNAGIREARGEIVAFLDGDDWWAPNKLSSVVDAMRSNPSIGIVGHGITMVHLDGCEQSEILREGFRFRADAVEGAWLFRLRRSFLGTSRMTIRTSLLQRIGPVPEAVVVQADEYLFTLAAALADGQVLPDALTYYRYHDANRFQMSHYDPERIRAKQGSLAALASTLAAELARHGINQQARNAITKIIQAEADQLRLQFGGGTPIETCRTEWTIYRVHNPKASAFRQAVKLLRLSPALVLPPRAYYALRLAILQSRLYQNVRGKSPRNYSGSHVQNTWRSPQKAPDALSDAGSRR